MFTKNCFAKEFLRNALALYLHLKFEKDFEGVKHFKIFKFAGDWDELQKKVLFTQAIANKIY